MDATYFRSLSARCNQAALNCFDLRAAEEPRHLANEFSEKAAALERKSSFGFFKKKGSPDVEGEPA